MPASFAPTVRLFGLDIVAATFDQAVDGLSGAVEQREGRGRIVSTPNVDHVVRLDRTPAWRAVYTQADYLFADGMPVVWASRMLGRPLPERVTGSDLFVALCRRAAERGWRVALLGGRPGDEAMLAERFASTFPGLDIHIVSPSMRFDPHGPEGSATLETVRALRPDLVFVCVGSPKQENWAARLAPTLDHGLVLCVGAAMEFAIGLQKRAPRWVQRAGLEWLWRLLGNPKRLWRRYLVDDPYFFLLCWREWRRSRAR